MENKKVSFSSIDQYIASFPEETQKILEELRATIKATVPDTEETISYNMPTFTLNGQYLVYFAAFKKHIGFYPAPIGIAEFEADLAGYESGKSTVKFPFARPMPFDLIRRIVLFRARENMGRAAKVKKK